MSEYERDTRVRYNGPKEPHTGKEMTVLHRQGETYVLKFGPSLHDAIYNVPPEDFEAV